MGSKPSKPKPPPVPAPPVVEVGGPSEAAADVANIEKRKRGARSSLLSFFAPGSSTSQGKSLLG
jgi:hypothetical protein